MTSEQILWIALDLETTGLNRYVDEIVQLASVAVRSSSGHFVSTLAPAHGNDADADAESSMVTTPTANSTHHEFVSHVRAVRDIDPRASAVTGITRATLDNAPSFAAVWSSWCRWYQGVRRDDDQHVVLVGHNLIAFDLPVLIMSVTRLGADHDVFSRLRISDVADTLSWSRSLKLPSAKLSAVYQYVIGRPLVAAHSALADARAVSEIIQSSRFPRSRTAPWWRSWRDCTETFCKQKTEWEQRRLQQAALNIAATALSSKSANKSSSQSTCRRCCVVYSLYFEHSC